MSPNLLSLDELVHPDFLAALRVFELKAGRLSNDGRQAEQLSTARGSGMEFADFKPYAMGDDLASIDWNIYRRLGRIFVKVFEERRDLPIYILVDVSSSMFFGHKPKLNAAMKTAMALASIGLRQYDRVGLTSFSTDIHLNHRPVTGNRKLIEFANHLVNLEEEGQTNLTTSLEQFLSLNTRPGLLVVISDFFDPNGLAPIFDVLTSMRHVISLIQLHQKEDANPTSLELVGDVCLTDCETQTGVEVTMSPALVQRYKKQYKKFEEELGNMALENQCGFFRLDSDEDAISELTRLFESGHLGL